MQPTQTTPTTPAPTSAVPVNVQHNRWSGARLVGVVQAAYVLEAASR